MIKINTFVNNKHFLNMKTVRFKNEEYATPKIVVYDIVPESGFVGSLENPYEEPEQDW